MFETLVIILPTWFTYSVILILGLVIGSFLDVVVTRFHTGGSVKGRSRCLSCGKTLSWYELVPCVSYLALCGRCHTCHSHIPFRLLLVELLTGGLFLLVYMSVSFWPLLLLTWVLMSLLIVVTIYDLEHMIIPNEFVLAVGALGLLIWVAEHYVKFNWVDLLPSVVASLGCFIFFASLWFFSKGRWIGFGDAKLSVPLGFLLGPAAAASFVVFSFWIGAAVSVLLLLVQRLLSRGQKRLPFLRAPIRMKSEVPFAPFMIAAFILVYLYEADVLRFMATVMYGSF